MNILVLGGRSFCPEGAFTLERDEWIMGQYDEAGLREITIQPGEEPLDTANRVLLGVIAGAKGRRLLSGLLTPVAPDGSLVEWSEAVAAETFAFLGQLTDPKEKQTIRMRAVEMIEDFWSAAPPHLRTLVPSSTVDERGDPEKESETASDTGAT